MSRHILIADGPAQPDLTVIDTFWERAQNEFAGLGDDYQVRSLGIDAETTTQILEYIKTRDKVATFSLPWVIEANGFPYSQPGTPVVLCDYVGTPHRCARDHFRGNRLRGILARWPTRAGPGRVDTAPPRILEWPAGRLRAGMH